jgi:hypothetical protein
LSALLSARKIETNRIGTLTKTRSDCRVISVVKYSEEIPITVAMTPGNGPQQTISAKVVIVDVHTPLIKPALFDSPLVDLSGSIFRGVATCKSNLKRLSTIRRVLP